MPSRALARGPAHDGGQQHDSILLLTCMSMTNKSRINLEPWGQHQLQKITSPLSSVLLLPLPYLALMAPKSDQLCIQSFFGIQGQGRQVVELVKAKRGRPPKAAAVQTCKELEARCSPTQTPSCGRQPSSEAATGSRAWGCSRITGRRACEVYVHVHRET